MKLNNYLKAAIRQSILDDIPHEDLNTKINDATRTLGVNNLPVVLQRAVEVDPSVLQWLSRGQHLLSVTMLDGSTVRGFWIYCFGSIETAEPDKLEKLKALYAQKVQQDEKFQALGKEIDQALNSVTTTNKFVARFPQFAKYVPPEEKATENLPAVTSLLDNLTAAGWPKSKAETQEEVAA